MYILAYILMLFHFIAGLACGVYTWVTGKDIPHFGYMSLYTSIALTLAYLVVLEVRRFRKARQAE